MLSSACIPARLNYSHEKQNAPEIDQVRMLSLVQGEKDVKKQEYYIAKQDETQ